MKRIILTLHIKIVLKTINFVNRLQNLDFHFEDLSFLQLVVCVDTASLQSEHPPRGNNPPLHHLKVKKTNQRYLFVLEIFNEYVQRAVHVSVELEAILCLVHSSLDTFSTECINSVITFFISRNEIPIKA